MSNNYIGGVAYTGTRADSPPNWIMSDRAPTIYDINARIGDLWMDRTLGNAFMLISLDGTPASKGMISQWEPFNTDGIVTVTGDDAIIVTGDIAHNLNVLGAHGINTTGIVAANSETIAIDNTITLGDLAPVVGDALTITSGDITIAGGNLNITNTASALLGNIYIGGSPFAHIYGTNNTFVGIDSGNYTLTAGVSDYNVALGRNTLRAVTTGAYNIAIGAGALQTLTTGSDNIVVGELSGITTGSRNVIVGVRAVPIANFAGNDNVLIGNQVGDTFATNESANVIISSIGVVGDNNTIRIADAASTIPATRCFIGGIRGITPAVADASPVVIDSSGQLGALYTPAFMAYLNASDANRTGDNTPFVVGSGLAYTEQFDIGGNLNAATGVFTAPRDGLYQFSCNVTFEGCAIATFFSVGIATTGLTVYTTVQRAASADSISLTLSNLFSMNAGNTCWMVANALGEVAKTVGITGGVPTYTSFSGYLVN